MSRPPVRDAAARVVVGGLAGAIAGIHLYLWSSDGYRHIPTIGVLFLLNGIAGAVLALASFGLPRRVVPLAWLATGGFAGSTLIALLISLNNTLFGFHESTSAPLLGLSIAVEGAAVLFAGAAALWRTGLDIPIIRRIYSGHAETSGGHRRDGSGVRPGGVGNGEHEGDRQ